MTHHLTPVAGCLLAAFSCFACDSQPSGSPSDRTSEPARTSKTAAAAASSSAKPAPTSKPSATSSAAAAPGKADFSSPKALLESFAAAAAAWDVEGMYACYKRKEEVTLEKFKKEFAEPGMKKEVQACFAKATFNGYRPDKPGAKDGTIYFEGCPSKKDGHIEQLADGTWRVTRF